MINLITTLLFALVVAYLGYTLDKARQDNANFVTDLLDKHQEERMDLVDRLMARDLKEVKQAQAIQNVEPRVISKRMNDAKVAEEARKVEGGC